MADRDRDEMEHLWYRKLREAEQRYRIAAHHSQEMQAESPAMPSPDGNFAFTHSLKTESRARREYFRILKIFTRLVAYGELPPEEETDLE